jgi:predicted Rossmann-fold nucleotide-binding protein
LQHARIVTGTSLRADSDETVDAEVWPEGSLEVLSQVEMEQLRQHGEGGLHEVLRRSILAVLNTGSNLDDTRAVLEKYKDFEVGFLQQDRGLQVTLKGAPATAFVDGKMIRGIRELLFAVLRDIVYTNHELHEGGRFHLKTSPNISNAIFHILRNARILESPSRPNLVICWGGHAISREEYDYTKKVGYELGLRGLNVCTGCGPGAMKGPMKGATIGHAKQRIHDGRYIGITEPGIIAAESPNPIVNSLVIMPDMEKRLEAFVRIAHGVVVFPGGVGTTEEVLYLLGILLHPDNGELPLPVIMTGPKESESYFRQVDEFVSETLGNQARKRYKIIIDDPERVARRLSDGVNDVRRFRKRHGEAYYFNWRLNIDEEFQKPFKATHESMRALELTSDLPMHGLAVNLRRVFSGIVSGNVRDDTMAEIEEHGPFEISGSRELMDLLDNLLTDFVKNGRMKLASDTYAPCYRVVK